MNRKEQIREALKNITFEAVPEDINLWPQIAAKIEQGNMLAYHSRHRLGPIILFVLLILAVAACIYAYNRLMMDPGLQGVEDAGMISDLELTAGPTVFPTPPWQPGIYNDIAQTSNGITVTLNWAYADESRMAFQLTIDGLIIPEGVMWDELICDPYITSDERVSRRRYDGQFTVLEDQPGRPIELTYIYDQPIDASRYSSLNLDLDLTIGPCANYLNFNEFYLNKPVPTPPPLIGNYHLRFQVPVFAGVILAPEQTVEANGLSMRLDTLSLSPSYTIAHLCRQTLSPIAFSEPINWNLDANLKIGESPSVPYTNFSQDLGDITPVSTIQYRRLAAQNEYCADLGFEVFYDGKPTIIVLTVERQSYVPFILTSDLEKSAKDRLRRQGIEVEFYDHEFGFGYNVLQKPTNMEDHHVFDKVAEAVTQTLEGPWVFVVEVE